jgi:Xaa-Pro aminopeptidase
VPSNKKLKVGESIIIDFGFKYKNYCSDFTRTVFLKTVPKKLEIAYNQVEKAYWSAIGSCSFVIPEFLSASEKISGIQNDKSKIDSRFRGNDRSILAGKVYQKAVDVLKEKKLDKYFIHSLGHGTGLEIHELPNLSPKSQDVITNNMVFSIEPGVYLPKVGGIRIEDLVYMENGQCKKFIKVATTLGDNIL